MSTGTHINQFSNVLDASQSTIIDLSALRRLAFHGCPDAAGIRSLTWKVLLGYLPCERTKWSSYLESQRAAYTSFINDMIIIPGKNAPIGAGDGNSCSLFDDHPLNPNPNSEWTAYFKENELLAQIDKDCRRLCPDLSFFQQATKYPCVCLASENPLRKRVEYSTLETETLKKDWQGKTERLYKPRTGDHYIHLAEGQEAHWEVVERILFIYAKLNPGLGYIQGMNEIIGPLYYTFASDPRKEWVEYAEADTFFCFTALMAEIRDNFITTLDDSACGIGHRMRLLLELLKKCDARLAIHLSELGLKPEFFAFRWLTLLLSQEYDLPDVIRIWDSLFADEKRFSFLIYVCCAMLVLIRDHLLGGDFTTNMKALQHYPPTDIQRVLNKAAELYSRAWL